ncbi:type II secretion system F family protein [Escherichia coli]|uniref:type II secretion system F family protein n=1 Tax=Escherichia coli TaxID=562 RepID=UPI0020217880|nr:type II secretion system F family protein [Escherichia coli]
MKARLNSFMAGLSDLSSSPVISNLNARRKACNRWIYSKTFSTADRLKLYEELAFLLSNNQRLNVALENMLSTALSGGPSAARAAVWLEDILESLNNGLPLDQALSEWVPRGECAIISSGLQDGNLPQALERASTVVRGIAEMKSSVFSVLAYPFLQLAVVIGLLKMIHDYFMPPMTRMFPREDWSGAMWWLGLSADVVAKQGIWLGLFFLLFCGWTVWSLPNVEGRPRRILDYLIPWSLYRDFQGVVFLLNVAALLGANVKTLDALNKLATHASPYMLERLNAIRRRVNAGDHLGLAMRNSGYNFPSRETINKLVLLTAGQNSDNSQILIERYAMYMLKTTIKSMKRRVIRVSLACFGLIGAYMGMLLAVIQQLNDLADHIGR